MLLFCLAQDACEFQVIRLVIGGKSLLNFISIDFIDGVFGLVVNATRADFINVDGTIRELNAR